MPSRPQATRFDVLAAQERRRKYRRDMVILFPLALLSLLVIGHAFAGFLTPLQ